MNTEAKGVPIRQPATANLMLDSADRNELVNPNPFDFQISRANSILNGFFTRIATTEVVLEWNEPNGAYIPDLPVVWSTLSTVVQFNSESFYTTEQALGAVTSSISSIGGDVIIAESGFGPGTSLYSENIEDFFFPGATPNAVLAAKKLGILIATDVVPEHPIVSPDLRPYRYIDFTSQQLTYNQDLKDSSTAPLVRDVLCRWYFDWDNQAQEDGLGFPIEMGYKPFKLRRLFNPPKQIKWDMTQPIGQLAFQVYGDNDQSVVPFLDASFASEWLMTLQVSET